jgi:DNA invertase Pin-like site-specific DNA recombinase
MVTARQAKRKPRPTAGADTTTPHGTLMLTVLGSLAEFERADQGPDRRRHGASQGGRRSHGHAEPADATSAREAIARRDAGER